MRTPCNSHDGGRDAGGGLQVHIILDSDAETKQVQAFLDTHPTMRLHFTASYSSWLNQVELWLAKIKRDVIARGIFTSTRDLARKLRRYIDP